MSKTKIINLITMVILVSIQASIFADRTITFEKGQIEPLKIVSGGWLVDSGKLTETSDLIDKQGRPLFVSLEKENANDTMLSIDFEVQDGSGLVYVCPAWKDPNNYTAVIWGDHGTIQIASVNDNKKVILAEKKIEGIEPPFKLGAAVSGNGVRAYINDKMELEAGVIFKECKLGAIGAHRRSLNISKVEEKKVSSWDTEKLLVCPIKVAPAKLCRYVFYRMEENGEMVFNLRNRTDETLSAVKIKMSVAGVFEIEKSFENIAAKKSVEFNFPVPAQRLRPDDYQLNILGKVEGYKDLEENFGFTIVKRPNPERMLFMNWGGIPVQGCGKLAEMGFTYAMNGYMDYKYIFNNPDATIGNRNEEYLIEQLRGNEDAMRNGIYTGINFNTGEGRLSEIEELGRIKRDGSKVETGRKGGISICPLLPKTQELATKAAKVMVNTFCKHPAFRFANINSEVRGSGVPCFHKEDIEAYKKATGLDIPEGNLDKNGMPYNEIAGFPENRIVPDNHPLLTYFRWYWKEGDGWVLLNDMINETIKKNSSHEFLCWHDPAIRSAPVYGSGGKLEMIGQWTYTNPDPIRVGMNADELINMTRGKQKVYENVQAIWYKTQTAVKVVRKSEEKGGAGTIVDTDPTARFITPSPAHMKEGLWVAMSRPVDMIGIHGINSLLPGNGGSYSMTNPDSAEALAQLNKELILPFGPMLKKVGNKAADVAFLESFASQVFAKRGTFGWASGDMGNYWLACQYAGLQPDIIFEETILEKGLGQYKVLIMSNCDVLPQSVYEKIAAFQKKGGLIIADEYLAPAIKPDILIKAAEIKDRYNGEQFKKSILSLANEFREKIAGKYNFFASSENPEVVLHTRENDGVQYVFAINDARAYGDYVGQYGIVMENGLPAKTTIIIQRSGVKVFDLLNGKEVVCKSNGEATKFEAAFESADGKTTKFDAALEPADGRIFVIIPAEPAKLDVKAPKEAKRGQTVKFDVEVLNKNNEPAPAILPISIEILDPDLRTAEPSGFYAAEKGKAQINFDIAENDRIGIWTIKVKELMTGLSKTIYLEVE